MRPLDGVRVFTFAEGPAVSLASMVLADFGAEVIRVEREGGDPWRAHPAARMTYRGQTCVTWHPAETARLRALVRESADAVIVSGESRAFADARDDLIVCDVSAFGRAPLDRVPMHEALVGARLGRMAAFQGLVARDGPVYSALQVATHATGQAIASAILAGLVRYARSGRGSRFATSLARGLLPYEMGGLFALQQAERGGTPVPAVDPHRVMPTINYHPVQCADGRWLQLGNLLPHLLQRFLELTGLDAEVPAHLRGKAPAEWPADWLEAFRDRLLDVMSTRTADAWMHIFVADGGVVAHPYQTTAQALDDPDVVANGHVVAEGNVRQLGLVARLARTPGAVAFEFPAPGSTALDDVTVSARRRPAASAPSPAPLDGITVVEFATIIAAPLGVACLADLGARVIKVEPIEGDPFRGMLNGFGAARVNAGKESIALDLKHPEGRRIAQALVARADVLVHNYRPGVPEKLGIGYADAVVLRPDIVYVAVNGYGREGPGALRPSTHPIPGGALGGVFCQLGGEPPREVGSIAERRDTARRLMRANEVNPDPNTSMVVATAALLGLAARVRHGVGQEIQVDMFGANAYANFDDFLDHPGKPQRRLPDAELYGLDPLYRLYRCRDGWIFLAAPTSQEATALFAALTEAGHPVSGSAALAEVFGRCEATEWEALLAPRGIGCVRADVPGLAAFLHRDPLARACGLVGDAPHAAWGTYRRHGRIVDYDHALALGGAPALGEHTRAILAELGESEDDTDRLLQQRGAGAPDA
jgi:crotonobetainyl-CoA:carnitine CoA-transferase CaiB-like acyl-CoA transferase